MKTPIKTWAAAITGTVLLALMTGTASAGTAGPLAGGDDTETQSPAAQLMAEAMAGRVVTQDQAVGALLLSGSQARRAVLEAIAAADARSSVLADSIDKGHRKGLASLKDPLMGAPLKVRDILRERDGIHENGSKLVEVALDVLELLGDGGDVALVVELASPWPSSDAPVLQARPRRLEQCLQALVLRDQEDALRGVVRAYRDAPESFKVGMISAVGTEPTSAAAEAFTEMLGVHRDLDGRVLNRLHGVMAKRTANLSSFGIRRVRSYLSHGSAYFRSQAASVLGHADDVESVGDLIEILDDEDRSARSAAHGALRRLTKMTMGASARRWRLWFSEQEAGWRERRSHLLDVLSRPDAREFPHVMNELAVQRLHRAEIAPRLAALLDEDQSEQVLLMVLAAIESLRADGALPAVVDRLEHPSKAIRGRAHRALIVVTGRDLPASPSIWRRVLEN